MTTPRYIGDRPVVTHITERLSEDDLAAKRRRVAFLHEHDRQWRYRQHDKFLPRYPKRTKRRSARQDLAEAICVILALAIGIVIAHAL